MYWPYNFNSLLMKLWPSHVQLCNDNTFSCCLLYQLLRDTSCMCFHAYCEGLPSILLDILCTLLLSGSCFLHFLGNCRSTILELFPSQNRVERNCKYLPGTRIVWDLSFIWEPQALELGEFSGKDMTLYLDVEKLEAMYLWVSALPWEGI